MTNARTSYRENEVRGASPVKLVVLLYEQIIHDLHEAMRALELNDVPLRTNHINHAILVVGHLQSALDFEKGEKAAQALDTFYNTLRQNIVQVQFFPSRQGLQRQITDLMAVREAWVEVERAERSTGMNPSPTTMSAGTEPAPVRVDWEG